MATEAGPGLFGARLQCYRLAAGLSQEELAERVGLSRRGISDLERGARRAPHPTTVRRLAERSGSQRPTGSSCWMRPAGSAGAEPGTECLRAALKYCETHGWLESGLRLAIALTHFWRLSGLAAEGRSWLAEFLGGGATATDESLRAMALDALGRLALAQGDDAAVLAATEEAVAIARRLASASALLPEGLHQLGWVRHWQGDAELARSALEESLAVSRAVGNDP